MAAGTKIDLGELVSRALASDRADIWTSVAGIIQVYYPGQEPTADILPVVKRPIPREDDSIAYEDLPVIPNVPILFPRGGKGTYAITWPLEPGDGVLLVFTTLSIDDWRTTGQVSRPGDLRLHNLGHAVAYAGLGPVSENMSQSALPAMVIEGPSILLGKDATEHAAIGEAVRAWLDAIKTGFGTHTHSGVQAGAGVTGPPAAPISAPPFPHATTATVVAAKVKVK